MVSNLIFAFDSGFKDGFIQGMLLPMRWGDVRNKVMEDLFSCRPTLCVPRSFDGDGQCTMPRPSRGGPLDTSGNLFRSPTSTPPVGKGGNTQSAAAWFQIRPHSSFPLAGGGRRWSLRTWNTMEVCRVFFSLGPRVGLWTPMP